MTDTIHRPTGETPGSPRSRQQEGIRLAMLTAVISGVAVWVNGHAGSRFTDPTVYTTGKNLVAACGLGVVLLTATRARSTEGWTRPSRPSQWLGLAAVGIIGGSVPFVLFFEGLARAGSTDAAFVHKTLVLWVALLAVPLLGERIGFRHVAAIGLVLWGQAALGGGIDVGADSGVVLLAGATACWAVEVIVAKRLLHDLSPLTVGMARMGIGSVLLVGWALTTSGADLFRLDAGQLGWIVLTGALLTGYVATWFGALSRAAAVDVTAVLVLGALITAGLGVSVDAAAIRPLVPGLLLLAAGGGLLIVRPRRAPTSP